MISSSHEEEILTRIKHSNTPPEISQSIMLFSDPRDRTKHGGEHTYSSKDKKT